MFARKLSDVQIKEGIFTQDLKVYKYLDKKFRPKTIAHVKANTGTVADADALYNQVLFQIYLNIENGKYQVEEGKFAAYFTRVMHYRWKDILRQRKRKRTIKTTELEVNLEVAEDELYPLEGDFTEANNATCLHKHINTLKDQDQQILKWYYFENLKQTDIAKKIDKTAAYVKQRIHRIREQLKTNLSADPDFT